MAKDGAGASGIKKTIQNKINYGTLSEAATGNLQVSFVKNIFVNFE